MSREKQIEEIKKVLDGVCDVTPLGECYDVDCDFCKATHLYNAGYRKQIVGEWIRQEKKKGGVSPEAVCSNCGRDVEYQVMDGKWTFENYCSHCGAKMKGGAE